MMYPFLLELWLRARHHCSYSLGSPGGLPSSILTSSQESGITSPMVVQLGGSEAYPVFGGSEACPASCPSEWLFAARQCNPQNADEM